MKAAVKLAFQNVTYYKKQTFAIFLGIVLSIALLTGIGSLVYSGERSSLEKDRQVYGDWHYYLYASDEQGKMIREYGEDREGDLQEIGVMEKKSVEEEPYKLTFLYGDTQYLAMLGQEIEEGRYPKSREEVALDTYTIKNLGLDAELGEAVELNGKVYTLCGILKNQWSADVGEMRVFVSKNFPGEGIPKCYYLKFDEERKLYPQADRFIKELHISAEHMRTNSALVEYLGGGNMQLFFSILKTGFSLPEGRLTYILASMKENFHLQEKGILLGLGLFCVFIIYSVFHISVLKRISQYGILQTLGISQSQIFQVLSAELFGILILGYPLGCLLGNSTAKVLYSKFDKVFVREDTGTMQNGVHVGNTEAFKVNASFESGDFYVSRYAICFGGVLLVILLLAVCLKIAGRIYRLTVMQMLKKEIKNRGRSRKIHSIHSSRLTGVLTRKFMLFGRGTFISILCSLALGGCIFLCCSYVTVNTQIHNELSFKTDDGLGSEYQVFEESDNLAYMIPKKTAEEIAMIPGIAAAYPVSYYLGEIPLEKNQVLWDKYCAELADDPGWKPDPIVMEKYNGRCLRDESGNYRMKCNIYGYDDGMLEELKDYLLEGHYDPKSLLEDNAVILKTWMDGQGNYGGLDLKPGDTLTVKVPESPDVPDTVLRFLEEDSWYEKKEFTIAAIVSRPMGKNDQLIGDDGTSDLGLIMTNAQMEENFGIVGYNRICIQKEKQASGEDVGRALAQKIKDIPKCMLQDYTGAIETQNAYLQQKMYFFYGISLLILVISMFHIMNSMQYLVLSRRHEFGILRAMGITDSGFYKMMLREGILYGIFASLLMLAVYLTAKQVLLYLMVHVYRYLQPTGSVSPGIIAGVIGVNLLVSTAAVILPSREIVKGNIIQEINE